MTTAVPPEAAQLLTLALLWALWCAPHSLLLQEGLRLGLQTTLGLRPAVYRLLYSLFSIVKFPRCCGHLERVG